MINNKRVRNLKKGHVISGPVLYWMSRDQRVSDNWALTYATELAENADEPVMVVFTLVHNYLGAAWRQFDFLLKGLKKTEERLRQLNIPFALLLGDPADTLPGFINTHHVSRMVIDFDPLKIKQQWLSQVLKLIKVPVDEVDAHNIVPCWVASQKQEFAAYTFRPKIQKLLNEFLDEFPPVLRQQGDFHLRRTNWEAIAIALNTNHSIRPVEWLTPGEGGAAAVLGHFIEKKMNGYALHRNDPNKNGTSGLSPYLHYGHIAAQRIALEIIKNFGRNEHSDGFLEELIIRRELADNFCYYNPNYDKTDGFPSWAKKTLEAHRQDIRDAVYTFEQFEKALTHDTLWNAAQTQMVNTGTMPGFLRMYWAKKILEWTSSPEDALKTALQLNDTYQLDGRDPNGYAGCAWSIGGVHDRAWSDRNVYGKIRYMNRKGCERKFDVEAYISRINRTANRAEQKPFQS